MASHFIRNPRNWGFLGTLVLASLTAADALGQMCQLPPAPAAAAPIACVAGSDGTLINSLPYTITTSGTYCLNFSPPSTNTGGISIKANNVVLKGQNRNIYGSVTITDGQNVTVTNINSSSNLVITAANIYSPKTNKVTVTHSSFHGGSSGLAFNGKAGSAGVTISDNRFTCSCDQAATEPICVWVQDEVEATGVQDFTFDHNVVESDCVKNAKFIGASVGGTPIVRQNITNNWFHDLRNNISGNEVVNITWRQVTGDAADGLRNQFANNNMVAEGPASCLYLRDDIANIDFTGNCCEVKNPNKLQIFYGAMMTSSGSASPHIPPNGLRFIQNKIYAPNDPAFNMQGYHEAAASENRRTIFRGNIFASKNTRPVQIGQIGTGALWEHNTFYTEASSKADFETDKTSSPRVSEFYSNIFACSSSTGCLNMNDLTASGYLGSNNLFFNYGGSAAVTLSGAAIDLATWQTGAGRNEDQNSKFQDPAFSARGAFNFNLTSSSPARGMGVGGTDAGALPYDKVAPAAPISLTVN